MSLTIIPHFRPFIVGSPPLSSGGSFGSENSEAMRRILSSGPVNLERLVDLDESTDKSFRARSPEIGSAVSAREHHLGTSESSSINGNKH
jgi:hypothetical protein